MMYLIVSPGTDFQLVKLQRCGGLAGVCVAAETQLGAQLMKRLSFSSIQTYSHQAEVFVEP